MKARFLVGAGALLAVAALAGSQLSWTSGAARPSAHGAIPAQLTAAHGPGPNISARVSPSWQTNNTVWAITYAKGVVYVGGQFTSVRPPGDPVGTGGKPRTYLAAFSSSTGNLITTFHPDITGGSDTQIRALAVSGSTLYVGGNFSAVNGTARDNLAAFNVSTGTPALTNWAPTAYGTVLTIDPSPDGSTVYLGGDFNELDGLARTYAGAVTSSGTGSLLPWAPVLNDSVTSIAEPADEAQVLIGGYFQTINGVSQNAAGAVDPTAGTTTEPWVNANIVPYNPPACTSAVKDIVISGSTAYLAAEGTGTGCFDGDFAVTLGSSGTGVSDALLWQNDCLGATQALVVIGGWLYKGSHAHDCDYAPGGFPETYMSDGVGVAHHLLDQQLGTGELGHWTPNTNVTTNGLGPRAMATDGSQLFVGGEFSTVNGRPQQGFARFGPGPDRTRPPTTAAPSVMSTTKGVVSLTFPAVSTSDVGTLTYSIYRDAGQKPIGTLTATSWPWALPVLHYREAGLSPGAKYTYRVTVSDGTSTSARSPASKLVTVSSRYPPYSYVSTVLRADPSFFWRLCQTSGNVATDSSPNHFNGIYEPGTTQGVPGPIPHLKVNGTATQFNGRTGLVTAANSVTSPAQFSIEAWFKTTTATGGKIIGFGSSQTGRSSTYDRQIYMMNDGQLVFGVKAGQNDTIESPNVYNDGKWHYVVATLAASGGTGTMALYVDGQLIGTEAIGAAGSYTGYWRVGGDNLSGWSLDPLPNSQGLTEPNSYYFSGTIGDVAVYPAAMSASEVAAHYRANALSH
jgi:Concanavalin A-like lectin/glucanases superfamily